MNMGEPTHHSEDIWCPLCEKEGRKTLFRCQKEGHDWANTSWWEVFEHHRFPERDLEMAPLISSDGRK